MKTLRNASRIGHLSFLSEQARHDIYEAVLEILGSVGMLVHHEAATAMLLEAGCTQTADGRILVPRQLVELSLIHISEPTRPY